MSDSYFSTTFIAADAATDLPPVISLTLASHNGGTLAPLDEANEYAIYIELPDRPDHTFTLRFDTLVDALMSLEQLQQVYPNTIPCLSTSEIQTPMLADTVWEGIVQAQAEIDEDDEDCHWVRVSRLISRADTYQESLRRLLKEWVQGLDGEPDVPQEILRRLCTLF